MMPYIASAFLSSFFFFLCRFSHSLQYTAIRSVLAVDLLNNFFSLYALHFGQIFPSIIYFLKNMFFNRFLNSGADTPLTNAMRTQFKTIVGNKYKAMATYTLRHILQLKGLKLTFKRSGSLAISIM